MTSEPPAADDVGGPARGPRRATDLPPRRWRPWLAHVVAALVVVAMGAGLFASERRVGVTVDEFGHVVRGLALFWAPDTRLNWPHPPLPHALVALPTVLREEPVDFTRLDGWKQADFTRAVKAYWRAKGYAEARRQLVAGRRMMMGLSVVVAVWLYLWARRRMGEAVGLVALVLWASHTTLLAHAQLVTNDFAAGCCALFLAATLSDHLRSPRRRTALFFAAACGVSVVTKASLVVIVLLCSAILLLVAAAGRAGFRGWAVRRRLVGALGAVATAGLIAWLAVLAAYRFDRVFLTVAEYNAQREPATGRNTKEKLAVLPLPDALVVPLPYTYVFSFQFVGKQNATGHTGWFLGEPNPKGNPLYFPVLALVKTPVGLLVLCVAGTGLAVARRRRDVLLACSIALTTAYFGMAAGSRINLGFRHASPAVAWMILLGTAGAAELLREGRRRTVAVAIVATSAVASAVGAVAAWPLFLGDFNVLGGGREGGLAINLAEEDWGQDVPDLAALAAREKMEKIHYFSRFSTMKHELDHFGAERVDLGCRQPVSGWVAIGVKDWTERSSCFRWMGDATPVHVVNDHILVFRADGKAPAPSRRRRAKDEEDDHDEETP